MHYALCPNDPVTLLRQWRNRKQPARAQLKQIMLTEASIIADFILPSTAAYWQQSYRSNLIRVAATLKRNTDKNRNLMIMIASHGIQGWQSHAQRGLMSEWFKGNLINMTEKGWYGHWNSFYTRLQGGFCLFLGMICLLAGWVKGSRIGFSLIYNC